MNIEEKDEKEYKINEQLTEENTKRLLRLLEDYKYIFVKNKNELGKCGIVKHRIDTGDAKPIKQEVYRASGEERKLIEEEVKKMLEKGVIEKSMSPWASPIVLV